MGKYLVALPPTCYQNAPETLPGILTGSGFPGGPGDSHFLSKGSQGAFRVDLVRSFVLSPLPPRKLPGWRVWDCGWGAAPCLYPESWGRVPTEARSRLLITVQV